jgi:DNA processing protein
VPKKRDAFAYENDEPVSELDVSRTTPAPLPSAPLDDAQRLACLRLIRTDGVGPVTFRELINRYGGATAALAALPDLTTRSGRGRPIQVCPVDRAEAELEAASRAKATPLFTIEPGYPPALAHVEQPPPMLYVRGDLTHLQRPSVAIVGSRDASAGGLTLARRFAAGLATAGYVIVSGLARGIDAAAHEASLETGTLAVVAGGLDVIYPPENARLHARICEAGVVISEMPPGFQPRGQDFPRRNRIISGMSMGVLVIEAARRSGTLITARYAGDQGREVFAVPGHPLDPRAEGTNHLLKEGATLVTEADDIISSLAPQLATWRPGPTWEQTMREARSAFTPAPQVMPPAAAQSSLAPTRAPDGTDQAAVLAALGPAPVPLDMIVRATGLPARTVQAIILELTLNGHIERHGGQLVSRRP